MTNAASLRNDTCPKGALLVWACNDTTFHVQPVRRQPVQLAAHAFGSGWWLPSTSGKWFRAPGQMVTCAKVEESDTGEWRSQSGSTLQHFAKSGTAPVPTDSDPLTRAVGSIALPNITRDSFCTFIRNSCEANGLEEEFGPFDTRETCQRLAVALFTAGKTNPLLRAYLEADCNVRFQGE